MPQVQVDWQPCQQASDAQTEADRLLRGNGGMWLCGAPARQISLRGAGIPCDASDAPEGPAERNTRLPKSSAIRAVANFMALSMRETAR